MHMLYMYMFYVYNSFLSVQMEWVFIMNRVNSQGSSAAQRRRMALGVVILLLVDVIWVASSELTSVRIFTTSIEKQKQGARMNSGDSNNRFVFFPPAVHLQASGVQQALLQHVHQDVHVRSVPTGFPAVAALEAAVHGHFETPPLRVCELKQRFT